MPCFQCDRLGGLMRSLVLCMMMLLPAMAFAQFSSDFKILPGDGAADDIFGESLSINGDYVIVGSAFEDDKGDACGT